MKLTFQTEVRLLSRGKVLMRVFQLSEEIVVFFLSEKGNIISQLFLRCFLVTAAGVPR
jgi:hypothetical protein